MSVDHEAPEQEPIALTEKAKPSGKQNPMSPQRLGSLLIVAALIGGVIVGFTGLVVLIFLAGIALLCVGLLDKLGLTRPGNTDVVAKPAYIEGGILLSFGLLAALLNGLGFIASAMIFLGLLIILAAARKAKGIEVFALLWGNTIARGVTGAITGLLFAIAAFVGGATGSYQVGYGAGYETGKAIYNASAYEKADAERELETMDFSDLAAFFVETYGPRGIDLDQDQVEQGLRDGMDDGKRGRSQAYTIEKAIKELK